jgi:leucyl aminopeptidase
LKIKIEQAGIQTVAADAIIVNLFQGVTEPAGATGVVDKALNGAIRELIEGGDLRGKSGETAVLYPRGAIPARRVIVVGLGKADGFDLEVVREASAVAIKLARKLGAKNIATIVHGGGTGGLSLAEAAQAVVEPEATSKHLAWWSLMRPRSASSKAAHRPASSLPKRSTWPAI